MARKAKETDRTILVTRRNLLPHLASGAAPWSVAVRPGEESVRTETGVGSQQGRCRVFFCEDRKHRCGHNWAVVVFFSVRTRTGVGS